MKLAMLTDTHFGIRNDNLVFAENQERFYREIFFPKLDELGIDAVLHLGDFWDNRKSLTLVAIDRAQRVFFDELEKRSMPLYIIYGNHDVAMKNTNWPNSIDFLGKMYKNVNVIKTHDVLQFGSLRIGFLSWVNKQNLQDSLDFINTADAPYLCGHFEIQSFDMTPGQKNEHGFEPKTFERFEKVFSGHFHTMSDDGRIQYISNTNQFNWSDYGLKKGFRVLDTETKKLDFVENTFVIYEKIIYTDDLDLIDFEYSHYENKIVRVYVESFSTTNQQALNLFIDKLQHVAFNVELLEVNETSYEGELTAEDLKDTTIDQVIGKYIDDIVQNDKIDKSRLKKDFMELYSEALSIVDTEA
jgi:DNA repair exonuclease SbcCD nuclease subunit